MSNSIRLHKKYGVNPTIPKCYVCGEDKNELALLGAAYKEEAPIHMCIDKTPCDKCLEYTKQGIIMISVRDGESGDNPYRTGGWVVVKEDAALRLIPKEKLEKRILFVEDKVWDKIGLPRK